MDSNADVEELEGVRSTAKQHAVFVAGGAKAVKQGVIDASHTVAQGVSQAAPVVQAGAMAAYDGAKAGAKFVGDNAGTVKEGVVAGATAVKDGAVFCAELLPGGEMVTSSVKAGYDAAAEALGPTLAMVREELLRQLEVLKKQLAELMEPDPNFDFWQTVQDIVTPLKEMAISTAHGALKVIKKLCVYLYEFIGDLALEAFPEEMNEINKTLSNISNVGTPLQPLWNGVEGGINEVSSGVQGIGQGIGGSMQNIRSGVAREVNRFQSSLSGIVESGTKISAADRLKEIVRPIMDMTVRGYDQVRQIIRNMYAFIARSLTNIIPWQQISKLRWSETKLLTRVESKEVSYEQEAGNQEEIVEDGQSEQEEDEENREEREEVVSEGESEQISPYKEQTFIQEDVEELAPGSAVLVYTAVSGPQDSQGRKGSVTSVSSTLSVKEMARMFESKMEAVVEKAQLQQLPPLPNRQRSRNLNAEKEDQEAEQMFNELCFQPFHKQGEAFLNAYWDEVGDQAEFIFQVAYKKFQEADMMFNGLSNKMAYDDGCRLNEPAAMYFYEQLYKYVMHDPRAAVWRSDAYLPSRPEMLTVNERRRKLKDLDKNFDRHLSFIEYLLDQYRDLTDASEFEFVKRYVPEEVTEEVEERALLPVEEQIEQAEEKVEAIHLEIDKYEKALKAIQERIDTAKENGNGANFIAAELELKEHMENPQNANLRVALITAEATVKRLKERSRRMRAAAV